MNLPSDDDLVLYFYRDGLDAAQLALIENALRTSAGLRARHARIEHALALLDSLPAPQADADLGARLWQRLAPQLNVHAPLARGSWRERWRAMLAPASAPRLAWATTAVLAVALGIGFLAGRHSAPEPDAIAQARADVAAMRVLDAYVAGHLRATEGVLLTASNSGSAQLLDGNRELATALVESNRLYARAAAHAGDRRLAGFLRELEPVLLSLANRPPSGALQPDEGLRDYLRETDLLFQVRATQARLERTHEQHL